MKNNLLLSFLLLVFLGILQEISADEPLVKLSHGGEVRGSIMKSAKGKNIFAFRGIPYAEPPTGDKRFKPPVPKTPWQDVPHDATMEGPVCPQIDMFMKSYVGQEDCLYLNVYTPELPDNQNDEVDDDDDEDDDDKKPVLVFIHGGGFTFGSGASAMYGPGKLLDGNVLLVSMNYRLGPLGFLSTNDDASRGNYGMMDQSLALKWVHENIESFGGDASRVTIFGESAGGASVGYHLLSPMSSGYFQAAIAQSGSPLCSWAFQEEPVHWAKVLANKFQCSTDSSAKIVDCLRDVKVKDIVTQSTALSKHVIVPLIYVPTLDGKFLTLDPREAMTSGKVINKVPVITGINHDEGIFVYLGLRRDDASTDLTTKKDVSNIVKFILDDKGSSDEPSALVEKKYYEGIDMNDKDLVRKVAIRAFSDSMFDMCHYETAKLLSNHGFQTYTYSLDYAPSAGFAMILGSQEKLGVGHADDLFLLFDGVIMGLFKPTDDDKKVSKIIRTLWTNLAKYGDPTPKTTKLIPVDWEPSGDGKLNILHISTEPKTSVYDTNKNELFQFWTEKVQKVLDKSLQRQPKDEL